MSTRLYFGIWTALGALVVAAVIGGGCSASNSSRLGDDDDDDDGSGASGLGGFGTGAGGNGFDPDSGPPCEVHCSADLHTLLDCNDNVILECSGDQGCSPDGTCVPACQSATENASTFGCDFFSVTPSVIAESRGSCFAVMVANTWTTPITVGATYGAQTIDTATYMYVPQGQGQGLSYLPSGGQLQPGELGILFLSKYESGDIFQVDCPVPQALEMPTQLDGTGRGQAFQVTTSAPIVAYDVYPWGGASSFVTSATMLVPTPTWGTNFVTADAWGAEAGMPWTQVVGAEDGTTVTMVPIANVQGGGGLPAMTANTPAIFTINRGEVVQFIQQTRLAGSTLQSDKPVSVWGGSSCMNIPAGVTACDAAHQQLLPVQTLGNEYVAVRYPPRGGDDMAPYTAIGMVDGTELWFNPMPAGAPLVLNRGDVAIFYTDQPFYVTAQDEDHPFYLAAHMTGGSTNPGGNGDPEYVNLVPPKQYLAYYLFATDPTYGNTSLVFVRKKASDGTFKDVNLDCMGPVGPWVSVGTDYEVARVMIVENGQAVGACNNGVHTATSEVAFGLTVWGYDSYASYAYPAGMSVQPINTVIVPPVPK